MRKRVAIVTDSTASVPLEVADRLEIDIIQLELKVGEQYNDERRVPHPEVAEAMRSNIPVATGEPPPPAFYWTYADAAASGVEAIISVHISEGMSKTCESARIAAAEIGVPVYVVDSRLVGLSMGFAVIAAAEAAAAGATPHTVMSVLDRRLRSTNQLLYVDTLEYLARSGRIGRAQAMLGQALSIKPVLTLQGGILDQLAKGIGPDRALRKAAAAARKHAGSGPVDVGVEHFQFEDRAKQILEDVCAQLPQVRRATLQETSAIIGAHTGPGALGIAISPAS
ncbi:DegV family protein [Saccharopolyspora griseoalba]|uniref:DegV family protein n=1 Tax=Saccharopolyspora griseoalba TaxID=1431848 RepID=A0ABW2LGY7_9PSEU